MHPTRDLPRLLNPPGGYVQNANNAPWHTSTRDRLDPGRYPKYVEQRELGLRPQMALQLLDGQAKFSVDDVRRLKHETRMLLADRVKPALLAAIATVTPPSEELQAARRVLEAWDNRVAAESVGALLFQRFWDRYQADTAQPFEQPWDPARPFETPTGLSQPPAALTHLEEAVRWTRTTYGSEAAKWGDVHRFRFGDLDLPADGASGTYGVYRVLSFSRADDGTRVAGWPTGAKDLVGSGDAWVLLVHFTRPVQAQSILAYGQTAHPDSRHGRDQIRLFAAHQLRPVWFTEAQIKANTERAYRP
jgi:acyl-homoserine-lactone acylase